MNNNTSNPSRMLLMVVILVAVAATGYYALNMPDTRTTSQKIGDAVSQLEDGGTHAGRELQSRTPAQRLEDAAHDAGDKIHDSAPRP